MTLQDEVLEDVRKLKFPPEIIESWESVADILSNNFPWKGSKIDWKALSYHIEDDFVFGEKDNAEKIKSFLEKNSVEKTVNGSKKIYCINDSSLDLAFSLNSESFMDFADYATIKIPQHHYFFDDKGSWCLAITSEGYIDFGISA